VKLLLKLAWRNIWRNRRRSILTVLAVVFATFLTIGQRGIQLGTYELNIRTAVQIFTGYLQVQKKGYQKNPSLNSSFEYTSSIKNYLQKDENIKGIAPRVYADGLISYKENSTGASIFGIDPSSEKKVTTFMNRINEGRFFNSDSSDQIVLGYKLLENLKAKIGDTVVILAQGYDGTLGNEKFKIVGTVKMGASEFDAMSVFVGLPALQYLLGMGNRINVIAVSIGGLDEIENVKQNLNAHFKNDNLAALSWDEIMTELKQSIQLDNVSGILFLGILIILVAFGVLNTVSMSVQERFREFGITLSIGMPNRMLVKLIIIETIFLTFVGLIIGNLIGWGINFYIFHNPIYVGGNLGALYEEYGFLPNLESSLRIGIFINATLSVLIISLIACLYPAYRVYRLEPLKGIRYT
jgi:putative ABC transport system permease protein